MNPQTIGIAALCGLLLLVAAVGFAFVKLNKASTAGDGQASSRSAAQQPADAEDEDEDTQLPGARRGAADRMRGGRLRQRAAARAAQQQREEAVARQQQEQRADDDDSEGSEGEEDGSGDEAGQGAAGRRGKKGRAREARREAREAERAAREARDARQAKPTAYEERRKQKEAEREAREKAQEEEIRRAAEEKQRQEDEEAAKWMGMISVEKEGTGEAEDAEENTGLLGQFVEYIKSRKTVPLEQLATEFKLRTTDVIDRINGLEAMGRITGVMDERGKYIYISLEEMKAVADFMVKKGRVAIKDLADKSSQLIDLEPKAAAATALPGKTLDFDALASEP